MTPSEPAATDLSGIELVLSTGRVLGERPAGIAHWTVTAVAPGSTDAPEVGAGLVGEIGRLQLLAIDLVRCADPWGALDASNADVAHIGDTVFDMNTGQLADRFDQRLSRRGTWVLLLDYVELAPEWQARNVAALLVAESLDQLCRACRVVLGLPGPLERRPGLSDEQHAEAVRRMQAMWSRVGFVPFEENVWFLDPNVGTLEQNLRTLRRQHDLPAQV
jgi:GNAT superfamily N-acetyltransferase